MLRKFADLQRAFVDKYGAEITVCEYYELKKRLVEVVDLKSASTAVGAAF